MTEDIATENIETVNVNATPTIKTPEDNAAVSSLIDPATDRELTKQEKAFDKLVSLAEMTLDPKDRTRKYAALGAEFLKYAGMQKASFKAWAKEDYKRAIDRVTDAVKLRVAISDVRMNDYVRVHAFVELVKPFVPKISDLSYYQIANKFIPMLAWDEIELTGEIRAGWQTFIESVAPIQLSDSPFTIKELDERINEHKDELAAAKAKKGIDPEKELERERLAAERKIRAGKEKASKAIQDAMIEAVEDAGCTAMDVFAYIQRGAVNAEIELPKESGFDPNECEVSELKDIALLMFNKGNLKRMRYLAGCLADYIAVLEKRRATMKAEREASSELVASN